MKRSSGGYRAAHFDHITGVGAREAKWADRHVYIIDGVPGLYRRVAKPAVSDFGSAGVIPAFFGDGTLIYLRLDVALEGELKEAGIVFAVLEGDEYNLTPTPDDVARANVRARELHLNPPATLLSGVAEGTAAVSGTVVAEEAPPAAPRKRAAGTRIVKTTPLPPITDANGAPLPGSLAAEGLGAEPAAVPPPPPPVVSIHQQIADADAHHEAPPPDDAPAPVAEPAVPAGQVDPATGMASAGDLDW